MQTTQRRSLELMLLGDFETGFWARSAVSALASRRHPIWPESAEFGMARDFLACLVFPDYSEFSKSQVLDDDYGSTWRHIDHLADN
ncbi:hypothetical protein [Lacticaseibacillus paracasei]|nr:hypothetical protein [Lacticaseibacillus paracasei]MBF4174272.1 hypothetical protein [Lacticaseibacillus paracasei subsp. tolerans]MCP9310363.1 hypothetical protein [Lacticaseibacillus paracasei]MCP9347506.1 hypothetical protein [Lacticaseibacillus paracasei]MCP9367122.1 hypothetical protein [Lacticaseibacillus paracasei]MCP9378594.1 hypothetical protein [Lacticaseibacillus paracasei]